MNAKRNKICKRNLKCMKKKEIKKMKRKSRCRQEAGGAKIKSKKVGSREV